ncbi:MAG: glycosyltransferase [Campylobacter lanienae]|uniref:glycosyltransferase family 2 protein n=1 Tax=Campylobacter lanienae TaxID=75658 RepID=UPI00242D8F69|nr:glycosyltransferase family 2 protein [Campylobacter lanienae]MCI5539000.1 glycosyltransferase [Campylobacter lanienae]
MKVSIIIPVYNVEKYISQCLDSAINQSLKDIEIIIVDDCGSDKSMDIAKEYAKNDSRIKIIKNSQNMGLFLARCEGIKSATGEYILNLDSDDFLDLRACEIAYNATKNGYYDVVKFSAYNYENGNTTIFDKILENDSFESLEEYSDYIYRNYGRKGYPRWNIWGGVFNRDMYLKAFEILGAKCRITMAEDVLMSFVLWNLSNKFRHISDILYYYRNNPDSSTKTKNKEIIARNSKDRIFVIKKIKEISKKHKFDMRITKVFIRHLWLCEIYDRMLHNKIGKIVLDIRKYVKSKISKS